MTGFYLRESQQEKSGFEATKHAPFLDSARGEKALLYIFAAGWKIPKVAVFAGATPGKRQSGVSLNSPGKLVKWGTARLRTAFIIPALSAYNSNPIVVDLRKRLQRPGKTKMTVIVTVMCKLVHLCCGVLKTRKPFAANYAQTT